jgi:hypothetical protein
VEKRRSDASASQSNPAHDEILACLATRDLLLSEAEKHTTETNIRRASAALATAIDCLRPARSPYEAQSLPESQAAAERQRCQKVQRRLAELQTFFSRRAA